MHQLELAVLESARFVRSLKALEDRPHLRLARAGPGRAGRACPSPLGARFARRPAVVAPVVLGGERPQTAADVLHVRHDQAHGLAGVQAEGELAVVLDRLRVDLELRLEPRARRLAGGLIRQREEEIHRVVVEGRITLRTQPADHLLVPGLGARGLRRAQLERDAQHDQAECAEQQNDVEPRHDCRSRVRLSPGLCGGTAAGAFPGTR